MPPITQTPQGDAYRRQALRNQIERVINELDSAAEYASDLELKVKNSYKINDENTPLADQVTGLKTAIADTSAHLKNTIIPNLR